MQVISQSLSHLDIELFRKLIVQRTLVCCRIGGAWPRGLFWIRIPSSAPIPLDLHPRVSICTHWHKLWFLFCLNPLDFKGFWASCPIKQPALELFPGRAFLVLKLYRTISKVKVCFVPLVYIFAYKKMKRFYLDVRHVQISNNKNRVRRLTIIWYSL